jgi:hypothetical protein
MSTKKPARKPATKALSTPVIPTVLILRTCNPDLTSYGGFRWPASGPVEAPDWSSEPRCGAGLHGWLWGEGDGSHENKTAGAKWLVVQVAADLVVDLRGKVKFPRGVVVFCGSCEDATRYVAEHGGAGRAIVRGTATAGDGGTATAGDGGTATAGYGGTATAGYGGTATAGDDGTLVLASWDGTRKRLTIVYVGEDGIEPNVAYRLDANRKPVRA